MNLPSTKIIPALNPTYAWIQIKRLSHEAQPYYVEFYVQVIIYTVIF